LWEAMSCVQLESCPPPPPLMSENIDWTVLGAVLGGLYAFVMLAVIVTTCSCWAVRRGQQERAMQGVQSLEQGMPGTPGINRQGSWMKRRNQPAFDLNNIDAAIKMGFIRKVYSILATQLALTVVIVMAMIYLAFEINGAGPDASLPTSFGHWLFARWWIMLVSLVPIIAIICVLQKYKNSYPINYVLLFAFTVLESLTLGLLCVFYYAAGYGDQILLAAAITLAIFLVLTLFTMQSKIDWNFLGPAIFSMLFILVFWSWFTFWLLPISYFSFRSFISLAGAIIFSLFIIYDTNKIMRYFGVDDYIIAAIELYLDVINLFQYLLMLLTSGRGD